MNKTEAELGGSGVVFEVRRVIQAGQIASEPPAEPGGVSVSRGALPPALPPVAAAAGFLSAAGPAAEG